MLPQHPHGGELVTKYCIYFIVYSVSGEENTNADPTDTNVNDKSPKMYMLRAPLAKQREWKTNYHYLEEQIIPFHIDLF